MIYIGYKNNEKQRIINEYCQKNKISKIYIFYFKDFEYKYNISNIEIEYIEYKSIEMYKYFYRLIEEIDNNSLLVFDECMRTQNRNELIYNCAHHYSNQSCNKIVFEYFPIIDDKENIMILFDLINNKYKGKSFNLEILNSGHVKIINRVPELKIINLDISEKQKKEYEEEKTRLFNNLGKKHPDTIVSNLELFVGKYKKQYIDNKKYIARNKRFKNENIETFKKSFENRILIDFPIRQLDLNDYIKKSNSTEITFVSSNTKVDIYYINKYLQFKKECEKFDKTSI